MFHNGCFQDVNDLFMHTHVTSRHRCASPDDRQRAGIEGKNKSSMVLNRSRSTTRRIGRALATSGLALYGVIILIDPGFALIDNVNLPIHETGHLVFSPFGELITALGGTLFQLIVPALFIGYFLKQRDQFAASVALWWVAENLWNIAVYVADAQEQALPLVGGGEHDWAFILAELDVLQQGARIAAMLRVAGTLLFVVAIVWGYASAASEGDAADAEASESSSIASDSPK